MNYLKELILFDDWFETNPLTSSCITVWFALMRIANKSGWPDKFAVTTSILEFRTGLKRDAIFNARNRLQQVGRIRWISRSGGQCAVYEIIPFDSESFKPTGVASGVASPAASGGASGSDTINKLNETKLNNINLCISGDSEFSSHTPKAGKVPNVLKASYGEFDNVTLTDEEHGKLIKKFGEAGCCERIESLSEYIASKNTHYASHYATILSWARKDDNTKDSVTKKDNQKNITEKGTSKYNYDSKDTATTKRDRPVSDFSKFRPIDF